MLMSMRLKILIFVEKLLKTMLFDILRRDVGELVLRGDVTDGDLAFTDKIQNVEES